MENAIILSVRIDYINNGKNKNHEQTAAEMVVKRLEEIHSIVDGVQITNVEVYNNGEQII